MTNTYFVCGDEVFIKLFDSEGKVYWTAIDLDDFDKVNMFAGRWLIKTTKKSKTYYATMRIKGSHIFMHRIIFGDPPNNLDIDHKNRNGLDNRKSNFRLLSRSANTLNSNPRRNNTSGIAGVSWDKSRRKWHVMITVNGRHINLGRFRKKSDAIEARLKAEDAYV